VTQVRLYCFDVFDTLLTRLVGEPVWLFFAVGQSLNDRALVSISAQAFLELRVEAENDARRKQPEVSVVEIWRKLGEKLGLTVRVRDACLKEELRIEEDLIRPVPGAKERIAEAMQQGKVIYLSDMYLPSTFIEGQLKKYGFWTRDSSLYVSSDWRCSKTDGSLFRVALQREGLPARCALHVGNNPHSDIQSAKKLGLRTRLYSGCALNRYEKILQAASSETESISSFMAGASRLARLKAADRERCDYNRALSEVAAGVAAPTLTAYLLFVFQRARELGLRRIYFVSRDGQILFQMARELAKRSDVKLELRYLYGSRQAWHLASVKDVSERQLDWIMAATTFLSLETALARVCLVPGEVEAELAKAGFEQCDWRRNLASGERERLRSVFLDRCVSERIAVNAIARRRTCLRYFAQEGLFDPIESAIVDVGWTGKALDSLATILRDAGAKVPHGFYFGLVGQSNHTMPALSPREGFYIDVLLDRSEPVVLYDRATILEMFCAGDHGQVQSYEEREGIVRPILKETSNQLVLDWGLRQFREVVVDFVADFGWQYRRVPEFEPLARAIGTVLDEFWHHPSKEEAFYWGSFPYFDDQTDSYWNRLAEAYTLSDLVRLILGREKRALRKHSHSWDAARGMLSSGVIRAGLKWVERIAPCRRMLGSKLRQLGIRKSNLNQSSEASSHHGTR
jgi:predicted HAD superfamily hydrolase